MPNKHNVNFRRIVTAFEREVLKDFDLDPYFPYDKPRHWDTGCICCATNQRRGYRKPDGRRIRKSQRREHGKFRRDRRNSN